MDATKLLETQHEEVKQLFEKLESQGSEPDAMLFEELARNLVAHDAIEREIFYPACQKAMGMTHLLAESLVEHGYVEFGLYQADLALGEDSFEAKCSVLKEMVLHHVAEEQDEFFPEVRAAIEPKQLEELGKLMQTRFEEVKRSDVRALTRANLMQVMSGALKTNPGKMPSKGAANGKSAERSVTR
jgi:hypothetical protein